MNPVQYRTFSICQLPVQIFVTSNIDVFKAQSDIILANRWNEDLKDVKKNVCTRDLFRVD